MADTIRHEPSVERANRIRVAGNRARMAEKTEVARYVRAVLRDEEGAHVEPLPARVLHASIWAL